MVRTKYPTNKGATSTTRNTSAERVATHMRRWLTREPPGTKEWLTGEPPRTEKWFTGEPPQPKKLAIR